MCMFCRKTIIFPPGYFVQLCGRFARCRILVAAVSCCNSQSETLILGNKLIWLGKLYPTLDLSLCHDLGQKKKRKKKKPFLWRWHCGEKQIECGLAWYVFLYQTVCVITVARLVSPQHFDHCDAAYCFIKSTYHAKPHSICEINTISKILRTYQINLK
mgnify:CR=1 FL=1